MFDVVMNKFITMRNCIYLLNIILFASCASYQNTTHSFTYHGTDNLGLDQDFFYIKYGVQGMSSTSYAIRTFNGDFLGGDVRSGLVADAKADLILQHPLEPNQAYANLSVDVMRTEKGDITGTTLQLNKITISAVITADVIEYGKVPTNYVLPSEQRGLGTLNMNVTPQPSKGSAIDPSKAAGNDIINSDINSQPIGSAVFGTVQAGDSVKILFKGDSHVGVVREIIQSYGEIMYQVQFDYNGKIKKRLRYQSEVSKLQLD